MRVKLTDFNKLLRHLVILRTLGKRSKMQPGGNRSEP